MAQEREERACPWCGETILVVAKKCKHCGEFLDSAAKPEIRREWRRDNSGFWRCVQHNQTSCSTCDKEKPTTTRTTTPARPGNKSYSGTMRERKKLSEVGGRSEAGELVCPRCGGSQFTAKRSNTGKVVGFSTLGVGGLVAPKSQVKCVACGLKFKRG